MLSERPAAKRGRADSWHDVLMMSAPTPSPDAIDRRRCHRRTLTVVIFSQMLGGAGLAAGVAVGALLAQEMLGSDALAGLPSGLFTLGSAVAAFLVGRSTQRFGRRVGLAWGFTLGGLGAFGVVAAAVLQSVPLLFLALVFYGSGTATNLQARYAGADLALPDRRGAGTSMAMVATTLGAVAGPNFIEPTGHLAEALGAPRLSGTFLLAGCAYAAAGLVLFVFLRPDPFLLARAIAEAEDADRGAQASSSSGASEVGEQHREDDEAAPQVPRKIPPGLALGAVCMVLTQMVMVAIMTMTPIQMRSHGQDLDAVGMVMGLHIALMWLPSLVTGTLVDRWGRTPVVVSSGTVLALAGVMAALAPGDSLVWLSIALMLLGLGWNLGLVAGTALVVDHTLPQNRARVQGSIDVFIALAGAGGGLLA